MRDRDDIEATLAAAPEAERPGLVALAERLGDQRPVPSAGFRGTLRRRLLDQGPGERRPARIRLLIGAYAGSGSLLLAVAAVGLAGAGPLAP
jgi:hypothetical protein